MPGQGLGQAVHALAGKGLGELHAVAAGLVANRAFYEMFGIAPIIAHRTVRLASAGAGPRVFYRASKHVAAFLRQASGPNTR
ncbi:hypothetical protein MyChFU_50310 [Mycobacterium intracellulare subsp. chimaera]